MYISRGAALLFILLTHESPPSLSLSPLIFTHNSQPTSSPTPMKQVEVFSGVKLTIVAQAPERKLRELQGLGGLAPPAVTALENTIKTLLEAGGLDVDSVIITHISNDGSGVLDITYKAMLNVSPDITEQEAQQQADVQLQESMSDECVDNCFSTELQSSLEEVGDDGCGDVSCDDLLTAEVTVSTVSICGCQMLLRVVSN